jgi:YidC/Oxa1 family membrane protein insertase
VWAGLVELVRAAIFAGSHLLGGSLGASVIVVSALVRVATLPLAVRAARHGRAQQAKLAQLRPQLERLKQRYQADPRRLWTETQALYRKHDIRLMSGSALISAGIQLPLLGALFSAVRSGLGDRVRFLWIIDLSRVDALLVAVATSLAGFAAAFAAAVPASPAAPRFLALMVAGGTLIFLWSASSAVALSVGTGSAVSILQNWLVRRDARRAAAAA